jgi:ANTAR domain
MSTDDVAREAAELFGADASSTKSLHQLAELAARRVPACSGAAVTLWRDGAAVASSASHPDLAALTALQLESQRGPTVEAARSGEPNGCADTLDGDRWPEFTAAALGKGVRCCVTLVHKFDAMAVTVTLYGVRPRSLRPEQVPLASLLTAFGAATLASSSRFDDAQRTSWQLREAVDSRAVVDQAKGILMHATGCDADEAFDRLRRVSQTQHIKLTDLARRVVEDGHWDADAGAMPGTGDANPVPG